ncbi:flagellar motor switch protein FliM [Paracoccus sp. ME4]|uniref:flagellar motor switch protein FliM n=1 Tax=Paracoccus sp. ME4 TaxID=3138066 RepID=UPI00398AB93C
MTAEALSPEAEIIEKSSSGIQKFPMLDVFFERIPLDTLAAFKSRMGLYIEAESDAVSYDTWSRIITHLPSFGVCVSADAAPWNGKIFVCIDPSVLFAGIETQMGGTPGAAVQPVRQPTQIERRMARKFAEVVIDVVAENFSRIAPVRLSVDTVEVVRQATASQPANAPVACCPMNVTIGGVSGKVSVLIPMATLEPVRGPMSKMFLGEKLGDITWREHIRRNIVESHVDLVAIACQTKVSMNDALSLRPGQIIDLGIRDLPEVRLLCAGTEIMYGAGGRCDDDRYAVKIEREAMVSTARTEPVSGFSAGFSTEDRA